MVDLPPRKFELRQKVLVQSASDMELVCVVAGFEDGRNLGYTRGHFDGWIYQVREVEGCEWWGVRETEIRGLEDD